MNCAGKIKSILVRFDDDSIAQPPGGSVRLCLPRNVARMSWHKYPLRGEENVAYINA